MLLTRTYRRVQNTVLQYNNRRWSSSYYDTLGITPKATQTEIKAAYYEKSKIFHPDKNQDVESAEKFRQITQAYEVLGNYRLRRLYDKGIVHTADINLTATNAEPIVEEDDPQTKFYKSRFHKNRIKVDSSRPEPIYDFDEWSRAHYGKSFERRKAAKLKYDFTQDMKKRQSYSIENERIIMLMAAILVVMYTFFYMESSHDTPKGRTNLPPSEKKRAE